MAIAMQQQKPLSDWLFRWHEGDFLFRSKVELGTNGNNELIIENVQFCFRNRFSLMNIEHRLKRVTSIPIENRNPNYLEKIISIDEKNNSHMRDMSLIIKRKLFYSSLQVMLHNWKLPGTHQILGCSCSSFIFSCSQENIIEKANVPNNNVCQPITITTINANDKRRWCRHLTI